MKRILSGVIAFLLVLSLIPAMSLTANAYSSGYYTYTVSNGEATITDCSTSISGDITIPSTLGGYPVTSINASAFSGCSSLTNVTIGDSVAYIGDRAFSGCSSLASVFVGDSVTYIGYYAFQECDSLISIEIPESVTNIRSNAFFGCSSLTGIWVNENHVYYSNDDSGALFDKDKTSLVAVPRGLAGSYTIPDSTTNISAHAFSGCNGLTSVVIPESVTSIGSYAFYECDSLISVEIPESVTNIGTDAFRSCDNLNCVKLPDSVTYIHKNVFYNCPALTSVTLGKYVTTIDEYAFGYCKSLTSVIIPDSVTWIRDAAFYECSSLTYVTLGKNIEAIGWSAFEGCVSPSYVWYNGSEEDRNNISLYGGSNYLNLATWHYKCCDFDSHIYDNTCDDTCNTCGCIRAFEHVFTNSCDTTCDECGLVRSITHVYDNKCDAVCNVCSYERTVPGHIYTNKCDQFCNNCGYERTVPDHIYSYICDKTCNVCGHKRNASHVYDNANDLTCNGCKQTLAPMAPIVETVTDAAVTLVAVDGYEYSKDGTTWQKSNVFTGLQPFTSYDFYQRVAASPDNLVSPASLPLSVKTDKYMPNVPAAPTVSSKTGTSVTLQAQPDYEYSMDSATWQKSNVFTGLAPITEYTFYQRIAETSNGYASASSQPIAVTTLRTFTVSYNANGGTSTPDAQIKDEGIAMTLSTTEPQRDNFTFKGWSTNPYGEVDYKPGGYYTENKDITLYAVWVKYCSDCGGVGHDYVICSICNGTGKWSGNISTCCDARTDFIDITPTVCRYRCLHCGQYCDTEYGSVSCDRVEKISCQSCSGLGYGKLTQPTAPQPELLSATLSSITVVAQSGMEYSLDGVAWQTSNVFDNLLPNTQYTVYQRYEENDYYNAGQTSEALSVSTLTDYTYVTGDIDGDEAVTQDDAVYLLLHTMFGEMFYPLNNAPADIDGSGTVDQDDAVYLLLHTMFGEMFYPLKTPALPVKTKE